MNHLSQSLERRLVKRHELLISQKDGFDRLFCINRGLVKVVRDEGESRETILRLQSSGDIVGLTNLMGTDLTVGGTAGFKAQAILDTEVCAIPIREVQELVNEDSDFCRHLLRGFAVESLKDQNRIVDLASKSVRARVVSVLLRVGDEFGSRYQSNVRIDAPLTREEIASLSGTVLESAVRALQALRKEHLISLEGREIVLLDLEALRKIAA